MKVHAQSPVCMQNDGSLHILLRCVCHILFSRECRSMHSLFWSVDLQAHVATFSEVGQAFDFPGYQIATRLYNKQQVLLSALCYWSLWCLQTTKWSQEHCRHCQLRSVLLLSLCLSTANLFSPGSLWLKSMALDTWFKVSWPHTSKSEPSTEALSLSPLQNGHIEVTMLHYPTRRRSVQQGLAVFLRKEQVNLVREWCPRVMADP